MPESMIEKRLKKVEERENLVLDTMQHQAVIESIKHGLIEANRWSWNWKDNYNQYHDTVF